MRKSTTAAKILALGLLSVSLSEVFAQPLDVKATVNLMNEANKLIEDAAALIELRCDRQDDREGDLKDELRKRQPAAANLSAKVNANKVDFDGARKAYNTAQTVLSTIDGKIGTLRGQIEGSRTQPERENTLRQQIADARAKKTKALAAKRKADLEFKAWKEAGLNDLILLRAVLAREDGATLSAAQKEALGVLDAYDNLSRSLDKDISDGAAAMNQATKTLGELDVSEKKSLDKLKNDLNDQLSSRPAAVTAVNNAHSKLQEITRTLRKNEALLKVNGVFTIPTISHVCKKFDS